MIKKKTNSTPTYRISLLKSQVYRAMNNYMTEALKIYNISPPEWSLIGILFEKPNLPPTEISQLLGVKPPVITASLRSLQQKRLIRKDRHLKDGRTSNIALTKKGYTTVQEAEAKMQHDLKEFLNGINSDELNTYYKVLVKISHRLEQTHQ